jgi:succinyl-diaminopimelate desuccinylase
MEAGLSQKVEESLEPWLREHEREMLEDIKALVRIPSISGQSPAEGPGGKKYPFGKACAQVVDEAERIIRKHGLEVKPCDYYGISAIYPGETGERIGFFSHLDVVPPGDGWIGSPFEPVEKDGYLIGRGVADNKGPAMAVLYTLKFFHDQKISLKRSLLCCLGANEESGMGDIPHFLEVDTAPALSLVADCGFPVCYGEKGILTADFTYPLPAGKTPVDKLPAGSLLSLEGGTASNIVPDYAEARINGVPAENLRALLPEEFSVEDDQGNVKVTVHGIGGHAAFPEKSVNALQKLAAALLKTGLIDRESVPALRFIADSFSDYYGQGLNIPFEDEISGKTTHVGSTARTTAAQLTIGINVRYAVTSPREELEKRLIARAAAYGYTVGNIKNSPPYYRKREDPVVRDLTAIVNETLGTEMEPYVMGGGTYARKLPRALGFGPGRKAEIPPSLGITGGGAHQANEVQCIQNLLDAIKIYVKAIIALEGYEKISI